MSDQHYSVLIVDDDKLILNTLKSQLESWQLDVTTAGTAEEAKQAVVKHRPDLIILDLLLTQSEGSSSFLDYLQTTDGYKTIPVLALTNLDKPELKQALLAQGTIKEYLTKGTLNMDELQEKVWSYLKPQAEKAS